MENIKAPKTKTSPTVLYGVCDTSRFLNYLCGVFLFRKTPASFSARDVFN